MANTITFDIETTGLNPWYGDRITCICAKGGNYYSTPIDNFECVDEEEIVIIRTFIDYLKQHPDHILVSANGKAFDVPFIMARIAQLDCRTIKSAFKELAREHFDVMTVMEKRVSLNNMAKLLGLGQKSGTGKAAIALFKNQAYTMLKNYCMDDVKLTEEVYKKVKDLR
jgi:uncharacterized protein YprB with RNaseH-like and TPR domain